MKEIPLTKGKVALVDDEDYEWLSQYKWCIGNHGYAVRNARNTELSSKSRPMILMHREILGLNPGEYCDHKDGSRLNNQRSNLRRASKADNQRNCKTPSTNKHGYRGVRPTKNRTKWAAYIQFQNRFRHIGIYLTIEDAARAYDTRAVELFGEFARTNFPQNERMKQDG